MLRSLVLSASLVTVSGCYLSVRGGPTVHRSSSQISFEKVGWNLSAYIGIQHDFLNQRLRVALNGGGGATAQKTSMGDLAVSQGGGGVEADVTLKNWVWWRAPSSGCDAGGALGARWRTGIGFHANSGFEEAGDITAADGTKTNIKTTGGYVLDVDSEWGMYFGKFSVFGGAGVAWAHNDTEMFGGIDAISPYAQVAIGFNVFFPRGLAVLMSHYPKIVAEEEAQSWRNRSCACPAGARDCNESQCEQERASQIEHWESEAARRGAEGDEYRSRCL